MCVTMNLNLRDEKLLTLRRLKTHYKCLSLGIRFGLETFSDTNVIGAIKYLKIQQAKWFLSLPEFILMLQ